MHRIDTPSATVDKRFTNGSPAGGVPATTVTAEWLNDIQENLAAVVEGAGIPLEKGEFSQVFTAIQQLISEALGASVQPSSETAQGIIRIATALQAQELASDSLALTPKKLNDAFKGANQQLAANGIQKLPGGLILQWGVGLSGTGAGASIPYNVAFPNAVFAVGPTLVENPTSYFEQVQAWSTTLASFTAGGVHSGSTAYAVNFRWFAFGY